MARAVPAPTIRLTDAARREFSVASADGGGDPVRLTISPRLDFDLSLDVRAEGDIVVEVDGITILLDPSSARRAQGVSIDYVRGSASSGFTIDHPRKRRRSRDVELARDCEVVLVPSGERARLARGERVSVIQALGQSFTVRTEAGLLARVAGEDHDALGLDPPATARPPSDAGPVESGRVIEELRTVFDPEIPVNVVDLGLVYRCEVQPLPEGGHWVEIDMSMTAPGCGMADVLREEARAKVASIPGVSGVRVEIVWNPPWDRSRMSEAARLTLGML